MDRIILIETSAAVCSTALVQDGRIVCSRICEDARMQASLTAPMIKEMLDECGISARDCDAVCVSKGPGSYTGLRVGVSSAKGLCFGAGLPLLAVGTLDLLAAQAADEGVIPQGCKYIVPLIDARRMEVYTAVFSPDGKRLDDVRSLVVEPGCFAEQLSQGPVLFIGDAADKCKNILEGPNAFFHQCNPLAGSMLRPALEAYNEKRFEDIAYFEPFYLKQFITTVSKKKLF